MNAREQALARDLQARVRLAADPIYQIKQRPGRLGPDHERTARLDEPDYHALARNDPEFQAERRAASPDIFSRQCDNTYPLTDPEIQALKALSRGLTIPMTATLLGKSPHTITAQLRAAGRKLAAKNATHAVAQAIRRGLIP